MVSKKDTKIGKQSMSYEFYLSKGTKHQKDVSTLDQCKDSGILQFNDSPI